MGPAAEGKRLGLTLQDKLKVGFGLLLLLALANGLFSFTQIRSIFQRTDYLARNVVLKQTAVQRLQAAAKAYAAAVTGIRSGREELAEQRVRAAEGDLDATLEELRALAGTPEEARLIAGLTTTVQELRSLGSEVAQLRLQEGETARGYQERLVALSRFVGANIQRRLKPVLGDPLRHEPNFLERLRALFSGKQITSADLTRYQSAFEMQMALADMGAAMTAHLARPEPAFEAKFGSAEGAFEKALGTYRGVAGPEEQIVGGRILQRLRALRGARERLLWLQREQEGRLNTFRVALSNLTGLLERALPDTIAAEVLLELGAVNRRVQGVLNLAFLLLGASLLIAMAAGIVIYRSISHPIRDLLTATRTVASGIFRRIPLAGDDEVGQLTKAFNAMTHSLRQRDIRLRVQQLQLRRANAQLAQANLHKSEFLANMSHELRTPLHAIMGFAEILKEPGAGSLTPEQRAYLENIATSGQHLLSLINEVLDLAKVESGRMELYPETFPLADALESLRTMVRSLAGKKNIEIQFQVTPDVTTCAADPGRFKQIMYNLLSNAIKFTPAGGRIRVAVDWASEVRPRDCLQVEVTDTGVGIRREDQDRIFEEFVQVDGSQPVEGTGLGLALTRKFVELHGGRIWVESEVGRGSTFLVRLPQPPRLRTAPVTPMALPAAAAPEALEAPPAPERTEGGALVLGEEGGATANLRSALLSAGFETAVLAPPAELADFGREVGPTLVACAPTVFRAEGRLILAELRSRAALQEVPLLLLEADGAQAADPLRAALALLAALRGLPATGRPLTVLVAADDPSFAQAVRAGLSGGAHRVLEAETEEELVAAGVRERPDLLVADVTASALVLRLVQRLAADPRSRPLPLLILPPPAHWPEVVGAAPGGAALALRPGGE
ncbi:MAG: hybrid sensor histidine kinase/response regulator [candidate division NC10 bacterium]|nr:hybrid sensor histidine kinase/response regulator [candidate division NC10 bacterium]